MFKSFTANLTSGGKLPVSLRIDPDAPKPVRQAVRLMYAGAALSAFSLILTVIGSFTNPAAASHIITGLVITALWVWMAKMNEAGRPWARISSTVLFGLWSIWTYIVINSFKGGVVVTVSLIVALALLLTVWGIGAATVYLLWRPASTAYFKAQSRIE